MFSNVELLQPIDEKLGVATGTYSNSPRIKELAKKNLQVWRNLEKFIVLETLKRKKTANN